MIFAKKEIDMQALQAFWLWFEKKEDWIIKNIETNGMEVVNAIDQRLTPVFPYFKKEIEFQLGFNNGRGEFFFYDLHNKNLHRDALIVSAHMPDTLKSRWSFIIEA